MTTPPQDLSLAAHPYRPAARFAGAVALVLALVTGQWFGWAAVARHRLRLAVDAVRARGEPTRPADFPNPPLPDADNGAVSWRAAMAALSGTVWGPSSSSSIYPDYPPFSPAWWTAARASEAANAAVFPLADRAAAQPRVRWFDGPSTVTANLLPAVPLNQARALANVLGDSALLVHFDAAPDEGRCLARLDDLFALSDALDNQPSEVSHLVSIGIAALADGRVVTVAADLDVGWPGSDRRRMVVALIDRLLADPMADERARVLYAERVLAWTEFADVHRDTPRLSPLADLTAARLAAYTDVDARAARQPDLAGTLAVLASDPTGRMQYLRTYKTSLLPAATKTTRLSRWFDYGVSYPAGPYLTTGWRGRAEAHVAAAALAVRLYRADHDGRWPADLAALVPAYLAAVPTDPLVAGSPPVGYFIARHALPNGGDRPMLYVGSHSFDPARATLPAEPTFSWCNTGIQWRDLSRSSLPAGK